MDANQQLQYEFLFVNSVNSGFNVHNKEETAIDVPINLEPETDEDHENSFTNYYSDTDNFNLYLVNEEVVYTQPSTTADIAETDLSNFIRADISDNEGIEEIYIKAEHNDQADENCVTNNTLPQLEYNSEILSNYSFVCFGCNCSLGSEENLKIHQPICSEFDKLLFCHICGAKFKDSLNLANHLADHKLIYNIEEKDKKIALQVSNCSKFSCSKCNLTFKTAANMKKHMKIHSSEIVANSTASSPTKLWCEKDSLKKYEHTVTSSIMKPYTCRFCNLGFTREKALASHERIHEDETWEKQLFTCKNCNKNFPRQRLLEVHFIKCISSPRTKKKIKQEPEKTIQTEIISVVKLNKHPCLQCSKMFSTKQKMYRHMWIHRKKAFSCEVCAKSFGQQNELDEHRLSQHAEVSPYVCSECGKSFASRQGLWEHNRMHSSNANLTYSCTECNKRFTSRQGYLIHNRTHTGEKPFDCNYCDKSFRDGGTLRKHQRIHTGERPHKCPLCEKGFNQKVVLREHVRWVHAANKNEYPEPAPYCCPLCTVGHTDREELCTHIVKHSDQIAAFNKENSKQNVSARSDDEVGKLVNNPHTIKPTGIKCDLNVIERNRIILKKYKAMFKPNEAYLSIDLVNKHECQMCGISFKSKEYLFKHIKNHI